MLCLATLLSACAETVQSGGFTVDKWHYDYAVGRIAPRATFDLKCPRAQLRFKVLGVGDTLDSDKPVQIGTTGCGRRAVYVKANDDVWIMDSASTRDPG
jgi:hypothetical protein